MSDLNVHSFARTIAAAFEDDSTAAWTTEQTGLVAKALKAHAQDDRCIVYVTIENRTFSLVVQEVTT